MQKCLLDGSSYVQEEIRLFFQVVGVFKPDDDIVKGYNIKANPRTEQQGIVESRNVYAGVPLCPAGVQKGSEVKPKGSLANWSNRVKFRILNTLENNFLRKVFLFRI